MFCRSSKEIRCCWTNTCFLILWIRLFVFLFVSRCCLNGLRTIILGQKLYLKIKGCVQVLLGGWITLIVAYTFYHKCYVLPLLWRPCMLFWRCSHLDTKIKRTVQLCRFLFVAVFLTKPFVGFPNPNVVCKETMSVW